MNKEFPPNPDSSSALPSQIEQRIRARDRALQLLVRRKTEQEFVNRLEASKQQEQMMEE